MAPKRKAKRGNKAKESVIVEEEKDTNADVDDTILTDTIDDHANDNDDVSFGVQTRSGRRKKREVIVEEVKEEESNEVSDNVSQAENPVGDEVNKVTTNDIATTSPMNESSSQFEVSIDRIRKKKRVEDIETTTEVTETVVVETLALVKPSHTSTFILASKLNSKPGGTTPTPTPKGSNSAPVVSNNGTSGARTTGKESVGLNGNASQGSAPSAIKPASSERTVGSDVKAVSQTTPNCWWVDLKDKLLTAKIMSSHKRLTADTSQQDQWRNWGSFLPVVQQEIKVDYGRKSRSQRSSTSSKLDASVVAKGSTIDVHAAQSETAPLGRENRVKPVEESIDNDGTCSRSDAGWMAENDDKYLRIGELGLLRDKSVEPSECQVSSGSFGGFESTLSWWGIRPEPLLLAELAARCRQQEAVNAPTQVNPVPKPPPPPPPLIKSGNVLQNSKPGPNNAVPSQPRPPRPPVPQIMGPPPAPKFRVPNSSSQQAPPIPQPPRLLNANYSHNSPIPALLAPRYINNGSGHEPHDKSSAKSDNSSDETRAAPPMTSFPPPSMKISDGRSQTDRSPMGSTSNSVPNSSTHYLPTGGSLSSSMQQSSNGYQNQRIPGDLSSYGSRSNSFVEHPITLQEDRSRELMKDMRVGRSDEREANEYQRDRRHPLESNSSDSWDHRPIDARNVFHRGDSVRLDSRQYEGHDNFESSRQQGRDVMLDHRIPNGYVRDHRNEHQIDKQDFSNDRSLPANYHREEMYDRIHSRHDDRKRDDSMDRGPQSRRGDSRVHGHPFRREDSRDRDDNRGPQFRHEDSRDRDDNRGPQFRREDSWERDDNRGPQFRREDSRDRGPQSRRGDSRDRGQHSRRDDSRDSSRQFKRDDSRERDGNRGPQFRRDDSRDRSRQSRRDDNRDRAPQSRRDDRNKARPRR